MRYRTALLLLAITASLWAAPSCAYGQSTQAVAGDADGGGWGLMLTYQQEATPPYAMIPVPIVRPSFRGVLIGGLPGPGDLILDVQLGGDPNVNPHGGLRAGLRLAPHDFSWPTRPALLLTGGIRSVPNGPGVGPDYSALSTHGDVGVGRLEVLSEFGSEALPSAFVLRVAYETHWTHLVRTNHDGSDSVEHRPLLASHLMELRLGFLVYPQRPASFFFESGFYYYKPFHPEERDEHMALIVSAGAAMGGGKP